MTAMFIIPNNATRFIGINLLSASPDTIIISKLTTISRMEYLSHTLRYCSIFFRTNISPTITIPTTITIAITRKHHDHSVEKCFQISADIFPALQYLFLVFWMVRKWDLIDCQIIRIVFRHFSDNRIVKSYRKKRFPLLHRKRF